MQALADMESDNRDIKVVNLCRLARRLAKQLERKEKK